MASEWGEVKLGNLIEIEHGFAFKGEFIHDEPTGDVLLTPGNFSLGGGFKGDKFKYYHGPVSQEYLLRERDLLVTMTDLSKQSDTLGYPALVPPCPDSRRFLHNQRLGKISLKDPAKTDAKYVYYVMCSAEYRNEVLASATGTTVKHTSPDRIKQFRFPLPPLPEQRAIAHILGTLDDKIELNRRMNETLEEMARALFKSWFVDFDPVRAKMEGRWRPGESLPGLPAEYYDLFPDRLAPSELGEIPEGWEVKALGDVAMISSGKRPPVKFTTSSASAEVPVYGGNGPMAFTTEALSFEPVLITGRVGTLGTVFRVTSPCWPSDNTLVIRPLRRQLFEFLFFRMQGIDSMALNRGSTQPLLTQSDLKAEPLVSPGFHILEDFAQSVGTLFTRIDDGQCTADGLAAIRDTLLPKLVSGEIRVDNLDDAVFHSTDVWG